MPDTVGKLPGVFAVHVRDLVAHDTSSIEYASAFRRRPRSSIPKSGILSFAARYAVFDPSLDREVEGSLGP
jgi:hypothetical protein